MGTNAWRWCVNASRLLYHLESVSWLALCFCHNTRMLQQKAPQTMLPPLTRLSRLAIKGATLRLSGDDQWAAQAAAPSTDRPGQAAVTHRDTSAHSRVIWSYSRGPTTVLLLLLQLLSLLLLLQLLQHLLLIILLPRFLLQQLQLLLSRLLFMAGQLAVRPWDPINPPLLLLSNMYNLCLLE